MKIFNLMPERFSYPVSKSLEDFRIEKPSWWQRLLVSLLIRSGLTISENVGDLRYKRIEIDEDRIVEHLKKLHHSTRLIYDGVIERVVCGPEAFEMMLNEFDRKDYLNVCFVASLRLDGPDGIRFFNIPVQVVGWIEGFALIPKMEIKG